VKTALVGSPDQPFFPHGYVMMQLNGKNATATYIQYDPTTDTESQIFTEDY
jgi:hypothetical protein